eukprot:8063882-Pyramimonas_sp.AAC.1
MLGRVQADHGSARGHSGSSSAVRVGSRGRGRTPAPSMLRGTGDEGQKGNISKSRIVQHTCGC